ncbi:DUF1675 domain-containing protein [Cephalotus follicularis]|uniref:Ninja-family protein n=1 Tax=Cephalotus follicularis TaxID=3775 RepID=A0A1Q3B9D8_CEPFO|nr:DUF1675 domain-containing protein [Cephalotus follicularis]
MAEAKKDQVDQAKISKMPKENDKNPPHLLQRFSQDKTTKQSHQLSIPKEPEQPDLNLKLSLGGVYNEINTKYKPLTISSPIIGLMTVDEQSDGAPLPSSLLSLSRCSSLPVEKQQEQKKVTVEELQAIKRMEKDKKMPMEEQRSDKGTNEKENFPLPDGLPSSPSKVASWAAASAAKSRAFCRAMERIKADNQLHKARKEAAAVKGSSSSKSLSEPKGSMPVVNSRMRENGKPVKPAKTKPEDPSKKAKVSNGIMQWNGMDLIKQMPCVTTTGDGPDGCRVEGFLYRYMKGQVSIVCVCHGSFLSPAEFVKHAGGKDAANPMKHINVCPASFYF